MREFVARLIKCGMPRDIAICVCKSYIRDKDWKGLQEYVEAVEDENKIRKDDEW